MLRTDCGIDSTLGKTHQHYAKKQRENQDGLTAPRPMGCIENAGRERQRVINDGGQAPRGGSLRQKARQHETWLKPEAAVRRQQESVVGLGAKPCRQRNRITDQKAAKRKNRSSIKGLTIRLPLVVRRSVVQSAGGLNA